MATSSLGYIDDIIRDQIAAAGNDASKLQKIATSFGLSADDLASFKGVSTGDIQQLFRDAGIPLGTLLTGDVQRTFGTDTGIRQVEKGDDIVTEQVVGVQGDKLIVQQYDAYGNPTSRRLTKPNPSELQGWLQALGTVGMAVGAGDVLSSLGGSAGAGAGAGAADLAFLEANAGAFAPGAELAAAGSNAGLASLNSNLASNLTVGEALSTISNPYSIITKPVTQTVYDYLVNTALKDVALSAGEKAVIKTAVGSIVNYSAAELTTGKGEQAFIGTWVGTAMNALPIPGTGEIFNRSRDLTFNEILTYYSAKAVHGSGLADYLGSLNYKDTATAQLTKELGELGINTDITDISGDIAKRANDLTDQLISRTTSAVANGISSGVKVAVVGGDASQVGTAVVLSTAGTLLGGTKIPGTSLTGNQLVDNVELDVDSFAEDQSITGGSGNDASVLVRAASEVVDSILGGSGNDFPVIDYLGTGKSTDATGSKKDSISAGSGNDSLVVSASGNDSINDTISDYIDLGGYNDLITSGSSNDSINAGTVEVTGVSDPCENPNQIRDPITGGCHDPIDYVVLGGSGNDKIDAGKVTVTAADCNKIGMDYDPIENKCVERVDTSKLSTFKPKTPTPPPATSTKVVDTFCKPPKIRDNVNGGCVCPPGYIEQGEDCKESAKVTVTAADCYAKGMGYDPKTNSCYDLDWETLFLGTPKTDTVPGGGVTVIGSNDSIDLGSGNDSITLGSGNDTITDCPVKGQVRGADNKCVCPPGTTEQNNECKPSVKVGACPALGQTRDTAGNCVCPPGQVVVNDTVSGGQICSTPETTITGGGGNDTITDNKCPAGYFRNSKGECEVELTGLPSLFKNLTLGGDGPASYTPNLTQPFTAARTYKAPPETYDYAGADTVGYEDPYFQRFGPITYTPPTGYLGAGVLPSPAGGTDTDTVDGAGVDTSGGGLAYGGLLSLARGGRTLPPRYLGGITDGMADRVPAHIDGKRPAALSDGEFVIPADVVSHLGNGNSSAGAKMLYEMMDRVRKARTGTKKQGREIDAHRFMPR